MIVVIRDWGCIVARLPVPGSDNNVWGSVLNDYLAVQHNADGTHNIPATSLPNLPQSQITGLSTSLASKVTSGSQVFNAKDYGAKGDMVRLRNVTATSASSTVTVPGGAFTNADVGKMATVYTDDAAGTIRTISSVQSATQITLSGAAGITVSGATGYIVYGTDDAAAIAAAFTAATPTGVDTSVGPNQPMGGGMARVILPGQSGDGGYVIGSQLTVPSGVLLDAPGMIVNMLADRYQPAIILNPYAATDNVLMECLFGTGIQAGTGTTTQAHITMGNIRLWHVGVATESSGAFRRQDGVALVGYHFELRSLFCKGGVRAVYHNPGSDAVIGYAYAIGSLTAVHINAGNQIAYPQLFLDTCGQNGGGTNGIIIDNQAANIAITAQAFQVTGTLHELDAVVATGAINTGVNKDIALSIQANNTGGTVLLMSYAQELTANIIASNAPLPSGATLPITSSVIYGTGNTGINRIDAMLETSITPYTGTLQGTYHYSQLDVEYFASPISVAGQVTAVNTPSTDIYNGNAITSGEELMSRLHAIGASPLNASGTVHLAYFTARKTETAANLRMLTDDTAATGVTLAKMGVYSVDGSGNLTLVASTASDTTLFNGTYTAFQRSFTASLSKVKGTRYAVAVIVVGAGMPKLTGVTCSGADASLNPRICGIVTGQADLPASITAASVAEDYRIFQATITP